MQCVGFGTEGGKQYAIIRNSWGTDWGDNGFVKVYMPVNNTGTCKLYVNNYTTIM
jgi:C1A family cysteine protease